MPAITPIDKKGCPEMAPLMSKKNFSKLEIVDLGLICGGDLETLPIVSRIDVREGMIKLPLIVVSQYRRCCDC